MKVISLVCVLFLAMALFCSCSETADYKAPYNQPELEYVGRLGTAHGILEAFSLDSLIEDAEIIAEIRIAERTKEISKPFEATFFKADIIHTYKGQYNNKQIEVMQEGNSDITFEEYPLFKTGDKLIVFLVKQEGEEYYWIKGGYGSLIYVNEDSGKEYAVKYIGEFNELNYIKVNGSVEGFSNQYQGNVDQLFNKNDFTQAIEERIKAVKND